MCIRDREMVVLENGKVCVIIDEIISDNKKYIYLHNIENSKDYTIRKEENDSLIVLDDEEEFEKAMELLIKKDLEKSNE